MKILAIAGALLFAATAFGGDTREMRPLHRPAATGAALPAYDATTQSPRRAAEAVTPPYSAMFTSDLCGFTVENANKDAVTWAWSRIEDGVAYCNYSSILPSDDWLFSVPIRLTAGNLYRLSFEAWGETAPERFEVKMGSQASSGAMTEVLLEPTIVKERPTPREPFTVNIIPEADGIYHIGFHACSDKDKYGLRLDNVSVSAPLSLDTPSAVTDLKAKGAEGGANRITLSFKAPLTSLSGTALTTIARIEIKRGAELVKTFTDVAAGQALEFTDELPARGTYNYTVTPYDASGAGKETTISCFCGVQAPVPPDWIVVTETATNGVVTVEWEPVTSDIYGGKLDADKVSYYLTLNDGSTVGPLSETSYTYRAVPKGEQAYVYAVVYAANEAGKSDWVFANIIPAGDPYTELTESFPGAKATYEWATNEANGAVWSVLNDEQVENLTSCDNDGGFLGCYAGSAYYSADYVSCKIDLSKFAAPGLTFQTFNIPGESPDNNQIAIQVRDMSGDKFNTVKVMSVAETADDNATGWHKATVPLTAYAGKTVQLMITATAMQYQWTFIDAITIGELTADDLKAESVSAYSVVDAGTNYNVSLTLTNAGVNEARDYTLDIVCDGKPLRSVRGIPIAPYQSATITEEFYMAPSATEPLKYSAVINYAADSNTSDNAFAEVTVEPRRSRLPAVTDLTAAEGARLSWSAPDTSKGFKAAAVTDFEGGTDFAFEYPGWTFIDRDEAPLGGFASAEIPGFTSGVTTGAYLLFNSGDKYPQFDQTFTAHSGDKYLAALFGYEGNVTADDWAVSPELEPVEQTVSFWARSYARYYPEALKVYASTGSTNPDDFTELLDVTSIPDRWTEYNVSLPEGTKHLAINHCSHNAFMLMLDDVSFIAADAEAEPIAVKSYNVYRDNELIANVSATTHTDADAPAGRHRYTVTVVYDRGESSPSNVAECGDAAIDGVAADSATVTAEPGAIVVDCAPQTAVSVVSADGRLIYAGPGSARVGVLPGVYIVRHADRATKVLVE